MLQKKHWFHFSKNVSKIFPAKTTTQLQKFIGILSRK